jgi:hypothetical protein
MPRRSVLSATERTRLLAFPDNRDDLIRHDTFSESDLAIIRHHRGAANRLGFAVQLCAMRYPGVILGADEQPFAPLLRLVATQLNVSPEHWAAYGRRPQTRREHLVELQTVFGFQPFTVRQYRPAVRALDDLAWQTDKGLVLAGELIASLRRRCILLPAIAVIERICAEAITRATRRIHGALTDALTHEQQRQPDALLHLRATGQTSTLVWLRQSPRAPNAKHVLEHIDRLKVMEALALPPGLERRVHQNRLLKLAREGGQMTAQHLRDLEPTRRYATLVAVVLEARATVIDEIVDLHDRIIGTLFNHARRAHEQQFQLSGKAINEKVRLFWRVGQALLEAKRTGDDPFAAIEAVIPWEAFTRSVAEAQHLAQPEEFDYLQGIGDGDGQIRRYAPALLDALNLKGAPAARDILAAVTTLKTLNAANARKVPADAPTGFIPKRWARLVFTETGVDRRFSELCTLAERKNALRSGDLWVQGSRQFKDFDDDAVPAETFAALKQAGALPLPVTTDGDRFLHDRLRLLDQHCATVNRLAQADELPDATITAAGLKITPLATTVPEAADALMHQASGLLPHVKITDVLLEVDAWTDFTRHFTHIKSGDIASDKTLLLTAILADAINLGLTKMAGSCPGTTAAQLSWLHAWHIRDETDAAALAELVNAQFRQPFAEYWGDGTTSSSDGQRFQAGGHAEASGHVNPKYGSEPGVLFSTHLSDQDRAVPHQGHQCRRTRCHPRARRPAGPTSRMCASRSTTPTRRASPSTSSR